MNSGRPSELVWHDLGFVLLLFLGSLSSLKTDRLLDATLLPDLRHCDVLKHQIGPL